MKVKRFRLRPCLAILLVLPGCSSPGVLITRVGTDDPPKMGTAPVDGSYGLFVAGQGEPVVTVILKAGDALGFAPTELFSPNDIKVRLTNAVAGNRTPFPIDTRQTYEWRRL